MVSRRCIPIRFDSFLAKIVEEVIDAGATVINIPDTVGYTTPDRIWRIIQLLERAMCRILIKWICLPIAMMILGWLWPIQWLRLKMVQLKLKERLMESESVRVTQP